MVRIVRTVVRLSVAPLASALALLVPQLWFLAPIALAFFLAEILMFSKNVFRATLKGMLFGTFLTAASLAWVWNTLPMDAWLAIPQEQQVIFLFVAWSLASILLALPVAAGAAFLFIVRTNNVALLLFPFIWMVIEQARLWVFAIYTYAESPIFGPHFSIASFGYTLTESSLLLQLAQDGGIHNLNFALALFAVLIVFAWTIATTQTQERKLHQFAAISLLIVLGTSLLTSVPLYAKQNNTSENHMSFLLLSSKERFGIGPNYERAARYRDVIQNLEEIPDVIVFPEGQHIETVFPESPDPYADFNKLVREKEILVIGNRRQEKENGLVFSTTLYEHTEKGLLQAQDKIYLAAFGEYMPDFAPILFSQAPDDVLFLPGPFFVDGGRELRTATHNGTTLGTLVCVEAFSPTLYNDLVTEHGAEILINVSNPSWFASEHYFDRIIQITKVHAVQNRKYFLTSAVETPAFVVDPSGMVTGQTEYNTTDGMVVTVPVSL